MNILNNIIGGFFKTVAYSKLPKIEGKIKTDKLSSPVEIKRDKYGVPHIYAKNINDLLFAQGYVHSQDRYFQMELVRRIISGTASSVLGYDPDLLLSDMFFRSCQFYKLAEQEYKSSSLELRKLIQSYCDGINFYLSECYKSNSFSFEISLLKIKPRDWDFLDVAAVMRFIGAEMTYDVFRKLYLAQLSQQLGIEKTMEFCNAPINKPTVVENGIEVNDVIEKVISNTMENVKTIHKTKKKITGGFAGSNCFAISGKYTESGKPFLCSDPHLELRIPSFFYENHLISKDGYDLYGYSIAGAPYILIGFNGTFSWGITLGMADSEDAYLEKIKGDEYLYKNEWKKLESYRETIQIKDHPDRIFNILKTRHGPLISTFYDSKLNLNQLENQNQNQNQNQNENQNQNQNQNDEIQYHISFQSIIFQHYSGKSLVNALYLVSQAKTYEEFSSLVDNCYCGSFNFTFADNNGNIGYYLSGKYPIRNEKWIKQFILPGWTGEYEWEEMIPFEKNPHSLNPKQGYVVSTNNNPGKTEYYIGTNFDNYRAERLNYLIQTFIDSGKKFKYQDLMKIQTDIKTFSGRDISLAIQNQFEEVLKSHDNKKISELYDIFKKWNYDMDIKSVGATIYFLFIIKFFEVVIKEQVKDYHLSKFLIGSNCNTLIRGDEPESLTYPSFILSTITNPKCKWIEDCGGLNEVIKTIFEKIYEFGKEYFKSENIEEWEYGKLHIIQMDHPFSQKLKIFNSFNIGPLPIFGCGTTINVQSFHPSYENFYKSSIGPAMRMIFDLGQPEDSFGVICTGNSENVTSEFYDNQFKLWYELKYHPLLMKEDDILEKEKYRLILL